MKQDGFVFIVRVLIENIAENNHRQKAASTYQSETDPYPSG